MKAKNLFLAGVLGIASMGAQAQVSWTVDTLFAGQGYLNNVYYSLEKGITKEVSADTWHLAFSLARMDAGIFINSADNAVRLYQLAADTADMGTDLTADFTNVVANATYPLFNSNLNWEDGAFNSNKTPGNPWNYGWGTYSMTSHLVTGERVYGLVTATDTFQIFMMVKNGITSTVNAPTYTFKIAKIDGTNLETRTVEAGVPGIVGQNFAYYNIDTDSIFSREPLSKDWDFVFTAYNNQQIQVPMLKTWYRTFGLLQNRGVAAALYHVDTVSAHDTLDYESLSLSYGDSANTIGGSWKYTGQTGYGAIDTTSYFVRTQDSALWQVVFIDFVSESAAQDKGRVILQKRKVYTPPVVDTNVSVAEVNVAIENLQLAPNPVVNGNTVLKISSKTTIPNALMTVVDFNGRVINAQVFTIENGNTVLPINMSNVPAGMYYVRVQAAGVNMTSKVVVH